MSMGPISRGPGRADVHIWRRISGGRSGKRGKDIVYKIQSPS